MRRETHSRADARFFTRTANRTKKINVEPTYYRGGIRL